MSRIRNKFMLTAMLTILGSLVAFSASAQMKIGYIQSDYVFSKYEPYIQAQKELDKILQDENTKVQKMYEDLQAKDQEFQSQQILMTDEAKQQRSMELQKQLNDLEQYHQTVFGEEGTLAKKQEDMIGPIIDRINEVLMRVAKDEGYDYIFDATAGGPILFANETHDISDHIIEELQKGIASQ